MPKFRIDSNSSGYNDASRFAEQRGLQRLGQDKLKPMADKSGVVGLDELERLARVADLNVDGKLTPEERKRIDAYLKERSTPIVAVPNSSAVNARASVRKPVDGYLTIEHKVEGKDLVFNLDISTDKPGRDGRTEYAKRIVLKDLTPNANDDFTGVSAQRYTSTGADGSVGYQFQGSGAGYIVGVADKTRGAVLVNLSAAGAIAGDAPDMRTLFTPAELAKDAAVKALAKKQGLDPKKLEVSVRAVAVHSDFVDTSKGPNASDTSLHTLALVLELRESGSRKKPRVVEMSTYLEGNVTRPLSKLTLDDLEAGVDRHWGFSYPPSFGAGDKDTKPSNRSDGVRDSGGGSEASTGGGGGEASSTVSVGGGGE